MTHPQSVAGPATGATTSLTYDGYGRVRTDTDSDNYTLTYDYDALDRSTRITYPDGTYDETVYNRLDAEKRRDRLGRWTHTIRDALRRVITRRDPLGRTVTHLWCTCGSLDKLIDANENSTTWERDLQSRLTKEIRANGSEWLYVYENTTSRLKRLTDPKGQHKDYSYAPDDNLLGITYPNPQYATPNVSFTYDANFNRLASSLDGIGTTTYSYHSIGSTPPLGAGRLASVDGPLQSDTITLSYDELGRVLSQAINGVAATATYDALARIIGESNALGSFTFAYDGVTNRPLTVTYPNAQTTNYTYYPNSGDHGLQQIHHRKSGGTTLSKFDYTYDAVGNIKVWTQQTDSNPSRAYDLIYDPADQLVSSTWRTTDPTPAILKRYVNTYDPAGNRTGEQIDDAPTLSTYDTMNRLMSQLPGGAIRFAGTLNEAATVTVQSQPATVTADNKFGRGAQVNSGANQVVVRAKDYSGNERTNTYEVNVSGSIKTLTYDLNGNMTGDGSRAFEWDAENRLIGINNGTLRSEFTYDGGGRRVRIVEKTSGLVTTDRRYLWCEVRLCEERDGSGSTVIKRFFALGMQESGASYYYAADHLASVREMTDTNGTIRARYDYDPYGRQTLVSGDKQSPFGFTSHFFHTPSSLVLTLYRVYDPSLGRWINEDPIGLAGGLNFYSYVRNNPANLVDPLGLKWLSGWGWSDWKVGPPPGPPPEGAWGRPCPPRQCELECLEEVFEQQVDDVRVEEQTAFSTLTLKQFTAITSPRGVTSGLPCIDLWGTPLLLLEEYYHVLRQWRTGRMTYGKYTLAWYVWGHHDNPYEKEARNFADAKYDMWKGCISRRCGQCE